VEHLVRRRAGLEHVVVDSTECHRRANRLRRRLVDPHHRRDEQRALRVWVQTPDVLEQIGA
jgi:hypothetical protein